MAIHWFFIGQFVLGSISQGLKVNQARSVVSFSSQNRKNDQLHKYAPGIRILFS